MLRILLVLLLLVLPVLPAQAADYRDVRDMLHLFDLSMNSLNRMDRTLGGSRRAQPYRSYGTQPDYDTQADYGALPGYDPSQLIGVPRDDGYADLYDMHTGEHVGTIELTYQ